MRTATPTSAFKKFISQYPVKSFKRGETILLKGERPKCMYVIESGFVKTYTITGHGDERLVSIDRRGEDFPIGFGLGLIDSSEYFYEAFTKCTVRTIPGDDYVEFVRSNVEVMYTRHVRLTILLLVTLSRVHALEQPTAGGKIAHTLMYMADRLSVMSPYTTRRTISITQQEIANALGLARETTSVELKKLEALKLIDHSRKSYVVYIERLKKYLDEH